EVVAFEPYPFPYGLAKKNLETNEISNVLLLNAGIGGRDGLLTVSPDERKTDGLLLKPSSEGVKVPIYSLDHVIEEYGPFDVMKMDCEGCEYDAIFNSKRIAEISEMQIEFHYGYKRLERALVQAGYTVNHGKPVRSGSPDEKLRAEAERNDDYTWGFIHAYMRR
ncbi:MAG: FkbM family methyltransferase, partial [Thermoprotei archaeon]